MAWPTEKVKVDDLRVTRMIINYYQNIETNGRKVNRFAKTKETFSAYSFSRKSINNWINNDCGPDMRRLNRGRPRYFCEEVLSMTKKLCLSFRIRAEVVCVYDIQAALIVVASYTNHVGCCASSDKATYAVARKIQNDLGWVCRMKTTSRIPEPPRIWSQVLSTFQNDLIAVFIEWQIESLRQVINFDEMAQQLLPNSNRTLERHGSETVVVRSSDSKKGITLMMAGAADGTLLPIQLIFDGKTERSLPTVELPDSFLVSQSTTHWSNKLTVEDYVRTVLAEYAAQLQMENLFPVVAIFDNYKAHCDPNVTNAMYECGIIPFNLPPNYTHKLQPCDLSINGAFKQVVVSNKRREAVKKMLRSVDIGQITDLSVHELAEKFSSEKESAKVLRNNATEWIVHAFKIMEERPSVVQAGFRHSGVIEAFDRYLDELLFC